jgi:pimeloyl-ACP methyl ester carboxylesterase
MQVVVDSLLTNYTRLGSGKTIVVLHGWGDNIAGIAPFLKGLSATYDVVAMDVPGFGGTQAPATSWGLDEYAHFLQSFLTKLNIKPYAIIGHSNGGAIAIRAISHGQKTEKLVLLASAGIRGDNKRTVGVAKVITKVGKVLAKPLPQKTQRKLRSSVYATLGSDMLVAEHMQETFKRIVADDVREDAAKINQPTLLIYGENDVSTPVHIGLTLQAAIPKATLEVIPNVGHMLPTDATTTILTMITEFLK